MLYTPANMLIFEGNSNTNSDLFNTALFNLSSIWFKFCFSYLLLLSFLTYICHPIIL